MLVLLKSSRSDIDEKSIDRRTELVLPLSLDPPALAVWIIRRVGSEWAPRPELIIDGIRRERRAISAKPVAGRVGIERVGAELPAIGVGLIVQPRRIRGEGIGRGLVAERAAVRAEGIIDAGARRDSR